MRNERKYKIITLLSLALALLLLGLGVREPFRMATAEYRQHEEYVLKGAQIYAENCVQCHGPYGEGVVGMPLNRAEFRVDPASPAGKEIYAYLFDTIARGREGNAAHYQWVRVKTPEGKDAWMSYTEMPAWLKEHGGLLDEEAVKALTLFIMYDDPSGSQWYMVGDSSKAPIPAADLTPDETGVIPLPDADVPEEVNVTAKALLRDLAKTQCLTCHRIGSKGAYIGPDLSQLGLWGIDKEFLVEWIKRASGPNAMPHDERMPIYWSQNRAITSTEIDLSERVVSEGPYYMPAFEDRLTDEEISVIADYLLGLK